ncbi:MAG TPA: metallophosphoesterase, partial [Myxococcaceae bacterium]|nr:metallophosphoesterase [Myxococcaceae bacterium]
LERASFFLIVRGAAMVLLSVGVFGGLHAYIGLRLLADSGLPGPLATAGWILLTVLFISIPAGFAASRLRIRALAHAVQWVSYIWIGTFGLLLTALVASDVVRWVAVGMFDVPLHAAQRVQAIAVSLGVLPVLAWGVYRARHPVLERRKVAVKSLPAALEGLRIVQISDLHLGPTLGRPFLESVVARVNALAPDIVAVTGDLVDGFVPSLRDEVAPIADLRGKLGVFYVTGNHEMYYGVTAWEAEVARLGLTVLHNEHRVLSRGGAQLVVAGIPDHDGGHFSPAHAPDPARAFAGAPDGAPRILLAHQPRQARHAAPFRVDLQLSGHTHGGQIFPFMFLVRLQQPVIRGLREISGVPVYTHRGTGYWGPPLRIGASPEIAELTLVSG